MNALSFAPSTFVTLGFVLVIAVFVLAAVGPLSHEIQTLVKNYPKYKANIAAGKGWAGKLAVKLHLTSYLKGKTKIKIPVGGVLGAGKLLLSLGVATITSACNRSRMFGSVIGSCIAAVTRPCASAPPTFTSA